jgi:hypothetical protein
MAAVVCLSPQLKLLSQHHLRLGSVPWLLFFFTSLWLRSFLPASRF